MQPEGFRDLAHLGSVELYTAVPEETRDFFVDLMAMKEVHREGDSIYVHAWDDYEAYTVKITGREQAGIGRTYLRASSPDALSRRVAAVEAAGLGDGWRDTEYGLGPVFHCRDTDGHELGLYFETKRYVPTEEHRPSLKNQASRFPGRGANVRRLDHLNFLAADVPAASDFMFGTLGARATERIVTDAGETAAIWYSISDKSYDVVYTSDWLGARGRLHHVAFATDTREDILRAADVFLEAGIHIETGPHKHAIQQTFFLYVWEPGGNRIELCNAGARLMLAPDWETITWTQAERAKGQAWGLKTIESFHTHGTPVIT
ncbi:catechol 2,3-dioxygenase [Actinocorallia herbida]|uniref:Catechol 2,3-dioxygenase n=1 Tax=Actinocorallia herbida TaxID=58109 RepID=A0A3N1CV78_9ACTN|nr:VOC family protein [Actinocorallia herbida]ROO85209.1 catechol 2,3-dioxygenase [Actinocorallia herbida]